MSQIIEKTIEKYLPENHLLEVKRILYGRSNNLELNISSETRRICAENNFEVRAFRFEAQVEELRKPRVVRIAAVQCSIVLPTTDDVCRQRNAILFKAEKLIIAAAASGVNIICFPETWSMPFGLCTQEKYPWVDFAEDAENGPTSTFLKKLAKKFNMVIVSPILERDECGALWNAAVVISNSGNYLGKYRKYHIPSMPGRHNESTYYDGGNLGHPVFETDFGLIGINICYDRHHPQHWTMLGLNGAEIVFNPAATISSFTSSIWEIEARNAAIANSYFTVAINRVGTELFHKVKKGAMTMEIVGPYYGTCYVSAPDGSRTPALSPSKNGLLITEVDLNLCRQVKDHWGFRLTQRLAEYGRDFARASQSDCQSQIVSK